MSSSLAKASIVTALFGWLSAFMTAHAASQQDYCIKCTAPNETYICRISSNSGQTQGKQFLCIVNIAREYGHESCAATTQSASCSGVLVQYEVSAPSPPLITNDHHITTKQEATTPSTKQDKEPRTLVEFTKKATTATKKGLKNAGRDTKKVIKKTGKVLSKTGGKIKDFTSAVGNKFTKATKTTLKCITSLFSRCSSD